MRTLNINEDEQVVLYKYEVDKLRSIEREHRELLQRLKENTEILNELQNRGPTTAIYHTADGLACYVRGNHSLPFVERLLLPSGVKIDPSPGEFRKVPTRSYKRGADIETFNGVYATYYEDASDNH